MSRGTFFRPVGFLVRPVLLAAAMAGRPTAAAPAADGLYATFSVSRAGVSVGVFSCRLEFEKAPRTVANFVGLAEGSRPFVDFIGGHGDRRPFYNGIVFHRVVKSPTPFVIQAGSPKGDGSDGPGYTFRDEFDANLRHNKAGILSMANSGLHSNGSQFFVTLAATPWLDEVHSVFGEVVEGMNVVNVVQQGDVIVSVAITRNGAAAQAFNPASVPGLPVVQEANPVLARTPAGFELNYLQPANSEYFAFHADAFNVWSPLAGKELEGVNPVVTPRDVSAVTTGKAAHYFSVSRVQYPDAIYTPPTVVSRRLTLANSSSTGTFSLVFALSTTSAGTFTLTSNGGSPINGQVNSYVWNQEAYRGRLAGSISGLTVGSPPDPVTQMNISWSFAAAAAGVAKGSLTTLTGQTLPLAGSFVLSDL